MQNSIIVDDWYKSPILVWLSVNILIFENPLSISDLIAP